LDYKGHVIDAAAVASANVESINVSLDPVLEEPMSRTMTTGMMTIDAPTKAMIRFLLEQSPV